MDRLTLYYAPGACSLAPHILLEETGLPYEPVLVDTKAGRQYEPDYLRINPKARVPALAAGEWVLTENPAILCMIAQLAPEAGLWPADLRAQARVMEWLAWLASTVHVAYAHIRRSERYVTTAAGTEDLRAKGLETCRKLWNDIESRLGDRPWALGEQYSPVDPYLMVFWTWGRGPVLGFDMARDLPRWTALARRMAARPAVARAFAREGLELPS